MKEDNVRMNVHVCVCIGYRYTLRHGKVPQFFKFADEDRDGDILDWSEDSEPISTPPSHLPSM